MAKSPPQTDCSLGGFDWLDTTANLRHWFAKWLAGEWRLIYSESLNALHTQEEWKAYDRMEKFVKSIPARLRRLSSADQLAALEAKARKLNLKTTRERVEDALRYFLINMGKQKEHSEAFKASPWCNYFATTDHLLKEAGSSLPYDLYPNDPDAQSALESVVKEFASLEILRQVSPAMSQLLAAQRGLKYLDKAIKALPAESPMLAAFGQIEAGLRDCYATLETEINRRANDPAEFIQPLRERRLQRCLYYSVLRLCKSKDGPKKLANFVTNLLKEWPYVPAGVTLDLEEFFSAAKRRKLVRDHLGLAKNRMNKEVRALWHILNAIVFRDELRGSLMHLARKARVQAKGKRKGWSHLSRALRVVFNHIGRNLYVEEIMRNFERAYFPSMRNLTREQRMTLLPELGNDPDHTVRDLKLRERMLLFQRVNARLCPGFQVDPDGRDSFCTLYRRAMRAVRKELGLE